MNRYAKIIP